MKHNNTALDVSKIVKSNNLNLYYKLKKLYIDNNIISWDKFKKLNNEYIGIKSEEFNIPINQIEAINKLYRTYTNTKLYNPSDFVRANYDQTKLLKNFTKVDSKNNVGEIKTVSEWIKNLVGTNDDYGLNLIDKHWSIKILESTFYKDDVTSTMFIVTDKDFDKMKFLTKKKYEEILQEWVQNNLKELEKEENKKWLQEIQEKCNIDLLNLNKEIEREI